MATTVTIEKLEKIIGQTSDTYIRHYESEIKYIQEKSKLSLWIVGLSIGMELFVLNKLKSDDISNCFNILLLIVITLIFVINSFLGLLIRIKQTRLYSHFLKMITLYDYQKTQIILNLDKSISLGQQVITDFSNEIAINKLKDLEYIGEAKEKNDPIALSDMDFLYKSDSSTSILLIIQAILTGIFLIIII